MSTLRAPAPVTLRDLEPADLPAVLRIEQTSFSTPWSAQTFRSLLRRADTDMIAAVSADRLLGYAVSWTILDQAELGNVAVAPEERARGIGRALVQAMLDRVRQRGAAECYLEVREGNASARALYERCGFSVIGRRRRYYARPTEDALVMRAAL